MARLKKSSKPDVGIPSCSLADMAFLLLIFFIVSTTFVKERGLRVELPRAYTIDKIPRANSVTIYVDRNSVISIDDFEVSIPMVEGIMYRKSIENPSMITCFRTDIDTQYGVMADIKNQMRRANVLRVSFEAKHKGR
jgi:biopolymer transport protein ExbD